MFLFGMIGNGLRGLSSDIEEDAAIINDLESYGIDWDDYDDPRVLAHHHESNPHDDTQDAENPFVAHHPRHFSHVEVEEFPSPPTDEETDILDAELQHLPFSASALMEDRRLVWVYALQRCQELLRDR